MDAPTSLPAPAASPVAFPAAVGVLYRDVLGVAFGFLSLADLASVAAVSCRWSDAAAHMTGIGASVKVSSAMHAEIILQSRLVQHVAEWSQSAFFTIELLARVGERAASLTSLDCRLALHSFAANVRFPPRLRSLNVFLLEGDSVVLSRVVAGLVVLSDLRRLSLDASCLDRMSLDFLVQLPQLDELAVKQALTLDQADALRQLSHLTTVDVQSTLKPQLLQHLVRSPLPPSLGAWKSISTASLSLDNGVARHLQLLPSLTFLKACQWESIEALASWPQLTLLEADLLDCPCSSAEIAAALKACLRLTRLAVTDCALTNEDLALVLPAMAELRSLRVGWLPQLTGLSSCALAPHLTELDITFCRCPALRSTELRHLHGLKNLTDLYVNQSCWLSVAEQSEAALLQPPSTVLPKLQSFEYHAPTGHEDD